MLGASLVRLGRPAEGEALMRAVAEETKAAGNVRARRLALCFLCNYLGEKGAYEESLAFAEEMHASAASADEPWIEKAALGAVVRAHTELGHYSKALPLLKTMWEEREAGFGVDDPKAAELMYAYADVLRRAKKREEAKQLFPLALERVTKVLGPMHDVTLTALNNYASLLSQCGDLDGSIARFRELVQAYEERGRPPTTDHLVAISNLGLHLTKKGDFESAEPMLRRAADASRDLLAPDNVTGIAIRFNHAVCLARMKRWEEAEPLLLAEYEELDQRLPPKDSFRADAVLSLAEVYEINGQPEQAALWRAKC